jgi:hypothetical protein
MSQRIALVSANFNYFDSVKQLPKSDGVDSFFYCDEKTRATISAEVAASWTRIVVPNYPRYDFEPRLRARYFKHQIHRLDEVSDHRWLVWSDSSIRFKETRFLVDQCRALESRVANQRVLVIPHPDRKTVLEEYEYLSAKIQIGSVYHVERYGREKMPEQMAHYSKRGWSVEVPLYCGTLWIIENSDALHRCWDDWWDQNIRFGMMDQLSLPIMLAQHKLEPQLLSVPLQDNEHFTVESHNEQAASFESLRRIARRIRRTL